MRSWESGDATSQAPVVGPPFGTVERLDVEWAFGLPADALADYVASRSYIITMPARERAAVLAGVRRLLESHPALTGKREITLPQVTRCSRADLTG